MVTWLYSNGQIEAHDDSGTLLLAIAADLRFAPLVDLINAHPPLGELLLHGYGIEMVS